MKSVLVVDDNHDMCQLLEEFFLQMGDCSVVKAYGGEEALEFLAGQKFDLVVTDILMPGIDGIDLISQIVEHYQGTKVLACSGGEGEISKGTIASIALDKAMSSGAVQTIQKPIQAEEFMSKIKAIFNQS